VNAELASLFKQRSFMRYWTARVATNAGTQMLMVAVGWEMYSLTDSAWDLGLVGLFQFLPALLLTLPAGHLADRTSRRLIFILTSIGLAMVAALLAFASFEHWTSRALLLGASVLLGTIRAFQSPAQQSLMPELVPLPLLSRATAFSSAGTQAAVIVGPALGGAIYFAGAAAVYGSSSVVFALAAALLLGVKHQRTVHPAEPKTWKTVFAGVLFIWHHKVVLGAVSLDLFAVLLGGAVALLPIFAKDILHVGPLGLGVLRAAPAVGALLMSVVLTRWPLERKVGKVLFYAVAVYGLCMLVFGLSTSFLISLLALMVSGMADMVSVVIRMSLVALETPDAMRGRVSAVNSIFIGASNQLGEFESGATAAWLGPVEAVVLGGVGTLLVVASWLKLFPSLAQRDALGNRQ
jgi:MFS family permease